MFRPTSKIIVALIASCVVALPVAHSAETEKSAQKTVLITGANRGIGLGFAQVYAKRGWRVIATTRDPAQATELAQLAASNADFSVARLDVASAQDVAVLAAALRGQPIDLLINNAGISGNIRSQSPGKMDMESFGTVLAVNTIGPLRVAEALLPNVVASQDKKIVNISTSEASFGMDGGPGRIPFYRASKSALNMLMLNYAKMVTDRGVTVLLVNPGPVDTDMMKGARMKLESVESAVGQMITVIDKASPADNGKFFNLDGQVLPW